ncbi:MAG: T9SS type A sorting domain-containing protein [bacterium]
MESKIAPFKIYLLIIMTSILLSQNIFAQIYVDVNNVSGVEDGTQAHPYNTIEEGIAAASIGNTVYIANGNYTPTGGELILRPGVKFDGASKDNTIINGDVKVKTISALPIGLTNLAFNDFVWGTGVYIGIKFTEPSVIKNCRCNNIGISHGGGYINETDLEPTPYLHIEDNIVQYEISYKHGAGEIAGENIIRNNTCEELSLKCGAISNVANHTLEYSFLFENNVATIGIQFSQGGSPALNTRIIVQNNQLGFLEIKSGGGHTYLIADNTIDSGISDKSGACWTTITRNTIINGQIEDKSGGQFEGEESQFIEDNIIHFTSDPSLDEYNAAIADNSGSVTIRNNRITCTGEASGIVLKSGYPTNVIGNEITLDATGGTIIYTDAGAGIVKNNIMSGGTIGYYSRSGAILFENNTITNTHTGFYSKGAEEVRGNTIRNCSGNGMILAGLRGPIHENIIEDNDSSGIWMLANVDLGGDPSGSIGRNIIRNNGFYDVMIEYDPLQPDTVYLKNNVWDHETLDEILVYDVLFNATNNNLFVDATEFIVKPISPILSLPADNEANVEILVAFSWQAVENVDRYYLQISDDAMFTNILFDTLSPGNAITIDGLSTSTEYYWRVVAENLAGLSDWSAIRKFTTVAVSGIDEEEKIPTEFKLYQNYPNPFNPITKIKFSIPAVERFCKTSLRIYDILGREVATLVDEMKEPGIYEIEFNGSDLTSGIYIYKLQSDNFVSVKKLLLLK